MNRILLIGAALLGFRLIQTKGDLKAALDLSNIFGKKTDVTTAISNADNTQDVIISPDGEKIIIDANPLTTKVVGEIVEQGDNQVFAPADSTGVSILPPPPIDMSASLNATVKNPLFHAALGRSMNCATCNK